MPPARFVAGDWGTTNLRLYLCDEGGKVLDELAGPGAASLGGRFPAVFGSLLAPWRQRHGQVPAVLCGMVGSTIGWTSVPYVACPARPEQIARACTPLEGGAVQLVPGLSCRNRFDAPDVMRGEETQILGALHLEPKLRKGGHLLCLPGTHTKWTVLDRGSVAEFLTAPTGELFALLGEHSVLLPRASPAVAATDAAFAEGLEQSERFAHAQLLHRLFECRSRRLAGELAETAAAAFLSGLLVASDVRGALRAFEGLGAEPLVQLIGAPQLTALYAAALAGRGFASHSIDGAAAALAGLTYVYQHLPTAAVAHGS
jgi:2-dehydro-3-deoxygalactonokinase